MKQIRFLEHLMYGVMEADTDTLREFLMQYTADDTEIDALQENAKHIWESIAFYHDSFALLGNGEIDIVFNEEIDGTENLN